MVSHIAKRRSRAAVLFMVASHLWSMFEFSLKFRYLSRQLLFKYPEFLSQPLLLFALANPLPFASCNSQRFPRITLNAQTRKRTFASVSPRTSSKAS